MLFNLKEFQLALSMFYLPLRSKLNFIASPEENLIVKIEKYSSCI